jgi:Fe-Mn family superoxide dismutase
MFSLPDLPYPIDALEPYIDRQTMEIHHGKHHATYVKNLNELLPDKTNPDLVNIIGNLNKLSEPIRTKVRNNAGGVLNHSWYWQWMSPHKSSPSPKLQSVINKTFGSLDIFKEKLLSAALSQFGSGWGWLVKNKDHLEVMTTPNQDSPISLNLEPILGVDVWEHAYYLKYQNRRKDYLEAWWQVVNWDKITNEFFLSWL